jgi:hypothetical protein
MATSDPYTQERKQIQNFRKRSGIIGCYRPNKRPLLQSTLMLHTFYRAGLCLV